MALPDDVAIVSMADDMAHVGRFGRSKFVRQPSIKRRIIVVKDQPLSNACWRRVDRQAAAVHDLAQRYPMVVIGRKRRKGYHSAKYPFAGAGP